MFDYSKPNAARSAICKGYPDRMRVHLNSHSGSDCKLLGRGCAQEAERGCRGKCLEDLQSTTRYVTWSLHTKSRASLKSMLNRVSSPIQSTKIYS